MFFFFFQAEDGIRDLTVTGVQTCALPISGAQDGDRRRAHGHLGTANRAPLRPAPLRCPAEKMDRRTHPRMDQPLSSARPRLRASRSQGGRVRPPRHDPPDAAPSRPKPLIENQNFAEGLLEVGAYVPRCSTEDVPS